MPADEELPPPVAASRSRLRGTLHAAWIAVQIALIVFALLMLLVRLVIFPRLERNTDELSRILSTQVGQQVQIGALETGWEGWNPRVDVRDLQVSDPGGDGNIMTLPYARLVVAWTSLPTLSLRLKEIVLVGPRLSLRRDAQGQLHIAGVRLDTETVAPDNRRLGDWLLSQPRIVVHGAQLLWRDEHAQAADLALTEVELRIENRFGHHRFGLRGAPPEALAAPLDLRGDFTRSPLDDWHALEGRIYARLDYADIAAWRQWLPVGIPMRSGKGAIRVWVDLSKGQLRDLTADVVLADVQARLADELPDLSLSGLEGRIAWHEEGSERRLSMQKLSFVEGNGVRLAPTDLVLSMNDGGNDGGGGRLEFSRLELGPLRQLAHYLPLPDRWHELITRVAPAGVLEQGQVQWHGEPDRWQSFTGGARLIDVGFNGVDAVPGVSGFSGRVDATAQGGSLRIDSRNLTIDLVRVLGERLQLDNAQGTLRWSRDRDDVSLDVAELGFANRDLAGSARGTVRFDAAGARRADLQMQLTRADARQAWRYLPTLVGDDVRGWMQRALVAGNSTDVRIKLSGALADFPFIDPKTGQFQLTARIRDAGLDYATGWPRLEDADGDLRIDAARMALDVRKGRFYGVSVQPTKVEIADMRAAHALLRIDGTASGPVPDFLRYLVASPLDARLDHPAEGVSVQGNGVLALKLELPLGNLDATRVNGEFTLDNARLSLEDGVPPLEKLSGKIDFTGREIVASHLSTEVLGGPAKLMLSTVDGHPRVEGQGTLSFAALRERYPKQTMLSRLTGATDWAFALSALPSGHAWTLDSSLKGASIDLPEPAGKTAAESMPLHVERRMNGAGRDVVTATYAKIARFSAERHVDAGEYSIDRAVLMLGGGSVEPTQRGFWIRGRLDTVDADAWLLVKEQHDAAASNDPMPLTGVDVSFGALTVVGRVFRELEVAATRGSNEWNIDLNGRDLRGSARWQLAGPSAPNGHLLAHLQRVVAPDAAPVSAGAAPTPTRSEPPPAANPWPGLDISADSLVVHNHELGKLQFVAHPSGADWHIEKLIVGADDGVLNANGWWRNARRSPHTELDVDLDVRDAGSYLQRFGLPGAIHDAPTKLKGKLAWAGSPQDFDYPTLNGNFAVDTGRGRFLRLDPGIGKLLGVLSLQAFRRRLDGDYQDIFGEGFAFDEMTGTVTIKDGVMRTDDLKIVGPAAKINITGSTDIARETQDLKIRVQPTLSGSVSVGAAALMIANPLIGAVVGAGSLLAQKVMQDPIEQIFSSQYYVSGSWSDPHIDRRLSAASTTSGPMEGQR